MSCDQLLLETASNCSQSICLRRSYKSVVVKVTDVGFWSRLPPSHMLAYVSLAHLLYNDLVDFVGHLADAVQRQHCTRLRAILPVKLRALTAFPAFHVFWASSSPVGTVPDATLMWRLC